MAKDLLQTDCSRSQTIKKARNRRNSGWEPEFLLPALSAAANSVIYVCVNSLICSLDALACRLFEGLQTIDFVDALRPHIP